MNILEQTIKHTSRSLVLSVQYNILKSHFCLLPFLSKPPKPRQFGTSQFMCPKALYASHASYASHRQFIRPIKVYAPQNIYIIGDFIFKFTLLLGKNSTHYIMDTIVNFRVSMKSAKHVLV
jgi:hypothetical protein